MIIGNPLMVGKDPPHYNGSYSISPTTAEQVLPVQGKLMDENLVIGSYSAGTVDGMGSYLKAWVEGNLEELIDESGLISQIADYAFYSYGQLYKASFPAAINIGAYAFACCSGLRRI